MRIAIVGAQGTGKTTLANDLLKLLPDYRLLPEVARMAADLGFSLDKEITLETEIWIAAKQYEMEQSCGPNWIADRSFIDLYGYLKVLFPENDWILRLCKQLMRPYDIIVFCPIGEFPIVDDGLRNTDIYFQRQIHSAIRDFLNETGLTYFEVKGDPAQRAAQILPLIKMYEAR